MLVLSLVRCFSGKNMPESDAIAIDIGFISWAGPAEEFWSFVRYCTVQLEFIKLN
jgi:hypothetical protein